MTRPRRVRTVSDILDMFRLDGRTAIVTGIGPGIGEHVAKAFAGVGARVVCAARTAGKVERVAKEIRAAGGEAIGIATDVSRRDEIDRLVERSRAEFGPIHILFNNAAAVDSVIPIDHPDWIWANTPEHWDFNFATQVTGVFHLAQLVYPDMKEHGKGSIITVGSCGGFTPLLPSIAYGVAKAGLNMLTRHLAKALAPAARVNMICVGSISPDGAPLESFSGYDLAARTAVKRIGAASEVVGAALLLASDASSYTTGSFLFVEGGRLGTLS
jgi:NAD(P)-dependent dehydrogenase (short-subunit alcohol dehydrogenase family)